MGNMVKEKSYGLPPFRCELLLSRAKFVVMKSMSSFSDSIALFCQSARHWRYFSATFDPLKRPLTFCGKGLEAL